MTKSKKKDILEKYYHVMSNPAAFSSPERVYKVLQKKYPGTFSKRFIQKWLDGIDSYSVQKQARHKFKTLEVRVNSINAQFEADLAYVGNIAKENENINYLLFVILMSFLDICGSILESIKLLNLFLEASKQSFQRENQSDYEWTKDLSF